MIIILQFFITLIFLIFSTPVIFIFAFFIFIESKEFPFFYQERIGKNNKIFNLYKIKTMKSETDIFDSGIALKSQKRILVIGRFLRKYKIDELPQILNILKGDMNIIGFRPDIINFSSFYKDKILIRIKPGLSSPASLVLKNENNILSTRPKEFSTKQAYLELIKFKIRIDSFFLLRSNFYIFTIILINTLLIILFSHKKIYLPDLRNRISAFEIPNNWNEFHKLVLDFKNF